MFTYHPQLIYTFGWHSYSCRDRLFWLRLPKFPRGNNYTGGCSKHSIAPEDILFLSPKLPGSPGKPRTPVPSSNIIEEHVRPPPLPRGLHGLLFHIHQMVYK